MKILKKYLKEFFVIAIAVFTISNIVGYFRSSGVKAEGNLYIVKNAFSINNEKISSLIKANKPLIIVFWGTWCSVCSKEVYNISALAKEDNFTLITIAVKSGNDKEIKKYMKNKGINFTVINDINGTIAEKFNISIYPTAIYFSPDRKKIIKDSGYTTKIGFLARVKAVEN